MSTADEHEFIRPENENAGNGLVALPGRDKPPPHPDSVRRTITFALLALLATVVLGTLISFVGGWLTVDELKDVSIILTPVLTLTGTAIGFYFGSSDSAAP